MKRLLIFLLAFFYLGVSFGANVDLHYCMGELVEWGINTQEEAGASNCENCGMPAESADNCCKNESKQVKIDSQQKIVKADYKLEITSRDLPPTIQTDPHHFSFGERVALRYHTQADAQHHTPPVFLLNRNLRI